MPNQTSTARGTRRLQVSSSKSETGTNGNAVSGVAVIKMTKSTRAKTKSAESKRKTTLPAGKKKTTTRKSTAKRGKAPAAARGATAAKKVAKKRDTSVASTKKAVASSRAVTIAGRKKTGAQTTRSKKLTRDQRIHAYHEMIRARLIDNKIITLYKQNKCHFQIGVAGHECIQIATSFVFRPGTDWFYPYYRDMALMVGLGMRSEDFMLNAMNKQDDPNSHGRQMPMHWGWQQQNVVNQSSPTGTQFLQAVGCALGSVRQKKNEVVYVSAGEGTCAQGDFHEALNWAARDKLPVIFVIQNNGYAISVPIHEQLAGSSVAEIVSGYANLASVSVDGTDLQASYAVMLKAHQRALKGDGPTVVEAFVPRLQSHSISDNHLKYRDEADIKKERLRCPIALERGRLLKEKILTQAALEKMEANVKTEIDTAAEWAEEQPDPVVSEALSFTYSDPHVRSAIKEQEPAGDEIYMVDAINHALNEELAFNKDMYIFGQDVAHGKGGVFTVTAGLTELYGKDRVFNSQLAESSIIGVAVGMATRGLKPVAEIQFGDYIWTGMMQIRNELAMMHYRSGGDFKCPAVIRVAVGGYIHGAAYHSQCIEATFAHFPGLYVVMPSNASDAKGLLKSAIRCDNPVLFLEHKGLYRQVYAKGSEGNENFFVPLGHAKTVREGTDITIVTYGALVHRSFVAAQHLAMEGISVEVIDLRTIVPLDIEHIFNSVKKTNRVLIAHEDVEFMGLGAEIAAQIASECFEYLDAPIKRVGMKPAAAVPHSPALENEVLPQMQDVLIAAKDLLSY